MHVVRVLAPDNAKGGMTEEDLKEIEGRLLKTTAASRSYASCAWKVAHNLDDGWLVASLGEDGEDYEDYYVVTDGVHASELRGGAADDARFIARAPYDVKQLIAEVRRCHGLLEGK